MQQLRHPPTLKFPNFFSAGLQAKKMRISKLVDDEAVSSFKLIGARTGGAKGAIATKKKLPSTPKNVNFSFLFAYKSRSDQKNPNFRNIFLNRHLKLIIYQCVASCGAGIVLLFGCWCNMSAPFVKVPVNNF